jgi:glycosyltransferase involved in cell wall biosynthesis
MRILALTTVFPNPVHPTRGSYIYDNLRLAAEWHDVRVISPIFWTQELTARWRTNARVPSPRRVELGPLVVDHPVYFYPPKIFRRLHGHCYRECVRGAFRRAVAEFQPEVVYSPFAYPDGWAAVELGHRAGLPVVVKVIGSDVMLLDQHRFRRRATLEALNRAGRIIAVSQSLADRVLTLGIDPAKVDVVYNGVDTTLFSPGSRPAARRRLGLAEDVPLLLFVGNLVPVKGVEVLLEAWARLRRSGLAFQGICIGQGPLRSALERQARALGLGDQVRFVGTVGRAQLPDWFRAASVCCLSSHSEGIPNVLLEATACGTPFVATRVGGISEIAHFGVNRLVPAADAAALADGIREMMTAGATERCGAVPDDRSQTAAKLCRVFEQVIAGAGQASAHTRSQSAMNSSRPVLAGEVR